MRKPCSHRGRRYLARIPQGSSEALQPQLDVISQMSKVEPRQHQKYDALIQMSSALPPMRLAVVHPCDESTLRAMVEAVRASIIKPILVGSGTKIQAAAAAAGIDITGFPIVSTPHSHAAAERAVELVHAGEADALMKGSLHTDELMGAVVRPDTGLRTERRISHVFIMDVPTYPKPLFITDAAVNILPTLEEKVDIAQNAIDLALALKVKQPKLAVLSAVETITSKLPSTIHAAALCKMAERGQITGALIDGPLALDNAISREAAQAKGIVSPVAGEADILLVPDLEAGNMLAKELTFLANADAAGIVLGARVPIVLTSRADNLRTRVASCAVASVCRLIKCQILCVRNRRRWITRRGRAWPGRSDRDCRTPCRNRRRGTDAHGQVAGWMGRVRPRRRLTWSCGRAGLVPPCLGHRSPTASRLPGRLHEARDKLIEHKAYIRKRRRSPRGRGMAMVPSRR